MALSGPNALIKKGAQRFGLENIVLCGNPDYGRPFSETIEKSGQSLNKAKIGAKSDQCRVKSLKTKKDFF